MFRQMRRQREKALIERDICKLVRGALDELEDPTLSDIVRYAERVNRELLGYDELEFESILKSGVVHHYLLEDVEQNRAEVLLGEHVDDVPRYRRVAREEMPPA